MKNILKKIWTWYCDWLIAFVRHDYNDFCGDPSVFEWCFRGFLFNIGVLGTIFSTLCLAYWIYILFCCWPFITSCFAGAIILFGIVLPLLVRMMSK